MIAVIILALWIGVALLVAWGWHRFNQIDREWADFNDKYEDEINDALGLAGNRIAEKEEGGK